MHKHSLFCRAAALVLTLALTAALALPGFAAAYAMPIQTAYDAEAVYLFDASTGEALVEQNPDQVRPIASLTKMMTALLVLESGADLNESIPIPDSLTPEFQAIRANRGHTIGLQPGRVSAASTCSTPCWCPAPTTRPACWPATPPGETWPPLPPG
ncbi:hypothetical protein [Faecalibacterium sp. OF04-11AC]|uniref:hypothetical protein n=1 Tax=Faecalibacterium sp. OF04-11AC TaxID=2293109 RepID=UPI00241D1FAB|nr:hypothetical protein [Faecalibacterium sp. OF04-11AC]